MSELYRIKINAIEAPQVRAEVKVIHPDASTKFETRDFALQILLYAADERLYWNRLPVAKEDWKKSIQNHPLKTEIETLQNMLYGEKVPSSEAEYEKLANNRAFYEARNQELKEKYGLGISSYGCMDEIWHIRLQPNSRALIDEAYRIIGKKPKKTVVKDQKGKALKKTYQFDFEVVDVQYLAHLVVGMEYDTAACELESYEVYYHHYVPPIGK